MCFDFHTHNPHIGISGIYNFRLGIEKELPKGVKYFTAGIHPWDIEDVDVANEIQNLKRLLQHENCLGIGEIGLDKHFGTNLELQLDVFRKQIELAKTSSKKVLIIHCVKAYQEIIAEKRSLDNSFIWVLHGFNGSIDLVKSLNHMGFYFSVGKLIFQDNSKIYKSIHQIPLDKLFLETDDHDYPIEEIYLKVSKCLNMDSFELMKQIKGNLKFLFPTLNG